MINAVLTAISRAGRVTNALTIRGTAAAWKSGCNRSISATAFRQTCPIAMWPPTAVEAGTATAIGGGDGVGDAIGAGVGGGGWGGFSDGHLRCVIANNCSPL